MRTAHLLAVVACALMCPAVPAAAQAATQIDFGDPAQFDGALQVAGATHVLLVSRGAPGVKTGVLQGPSELEVWNHTQAGEHMDARPYIDARIPRPTGESSRWDGHVAGFGFSSRPDTITGLQIDAADILLRTRGAGRFTATGASLSQWDHSYDAMTLPYRDRAVADGTLGVVVAQAVDVDVVATGVTAIEWLGLQLECGSADCPEGGAVQFDRLNGSGVVGLSTYGRSLMEARLGGGVVRMSGQFDLVILTSREVDAHLVGLGRFPAARAAPGACGGCPALDGETLAVNGTFAMGRLRKADDSRLAATVEGDMNEARVDEVTVAAEHRALAILGPTAAGAGGIGFLWLSFALFTRYSKAQALENANRKKLFDVVLASPGINFRELARDSGVPAGTARYHLTILTRSGLIVEKPHHNLLRFFENHGRYEANWNRVGILRDPDLKILHDWIVPRGTLPQKDVLNAMEAQQGWSRSTTQHRLSRLVGDGLVDVRIQGRYRMYCARQLPAPAKTVGLDPNIVPASSA